MKTKSIRQTVTLSATPERIYRMLMDQKEHSAFTGSKAVISNKANGKFSVFDGYCKGNNIELVEGKKIVQAWHFEEEGWPENHYSTCTFLLQKDGNKTKLKFLQTDVPEVSVTSLKGGWKQFYWDAMKTYLKANAV
jgi:activator of HSP90 ATPase